jgi:cobalt transporter subunit CbtA
MIRHFLTSALLAGFLAGLAVTGLQQATTAPLILQAEQFEEAASAPASGTPQGHDHAAHDPAQAAVHAHGADGGGWAPADGLDRLFFTTLANVIAAIGFAFVLVACLVLWNGRASGQTGILWGLAGFAVSSRGKSGGSSPPRRPPPACGCWCFRAVRWPRPPGSS